MPTTVKIDGVGEIDFPDAMSESDIAASIKSNLPNWQTHGASGSWGNTPGEQVVGRLAKGAASGIAGPLEAIGIAATGLAQKFGDPILGERGGKLAERPTYQAGQYLRRKTAEAFPVDESRPHSFLADTLPEAAGSMGAFVVGGLAGKVAKASGAATVAALGAGSSGADAFNEAKKKGASDDDAFKVFAINAGLGTTEAVPIGGWLARLNKASGNRLTRAIREGSEEALQEVFQQYGSNITAQKYYDPERPWHTGIIEGGAAGMTLGSLMSLVVSGIGGRRARLAGGTDSAIDQGDIKTRDLGEISGTREIVQDNNQDQIVPPQDPASSAETIQRGSAAGVVRFYHGGVPGEGARDVTTRYDYAKGYADKSPGGIVQYVDIPKNHPLLTKAFDDTGLSYEAPYNAFTAPAELMAQAKPLPVVEVAKPASEKPIAPFGHYVENATGQLIPTFSVPVATMPGRTSQVSREKAEAKGFVVSAELPPQTSQNTITRPGKEVSDEQKEKGQVQVQSLQVSTAPSGGAIVSPEIPDAVETPPQTGKTFTAIAYRGISSDTPNDKGIYSAGTHYTTSEEYALEYGPKKKQGGQVIERSITLQNPFVATPDEMTKLNHSLSSAEVRSKYESLGHDGIVILHPDNVAAAKAAGVPERLLPPFYGKEIIVFSRESPSSNPLSAASVPSAGGDNNVVQLTRDDAQEVIHKITILTEEQDLQEDYGISNDQALSLLKSIPQNGGEWIIPREAFVAVIGELEDHANVLRQIASDAFSGGETGQSLRINKQAKKFESIVGQLRGRGSLSASTAPQQIGQTLTDSQPLIDQALSIGGGSEALRAAIPQIRFRYGPLSTGAAMQYEDGVITINKPIIDFVASQYPQHAQSYINKLISEELLHAVTYMALDDRDLVLVGKEMSSIDRNRLMADRPDIANLFNREEQNRQLGGEFIRQVLQRESGGGTTEEAIPIDPNSSFGVRVLDALRKIWEYLTNLFRGKQSPIIEQALAKVRQAMVDVQAGSIKVGGGPLNSEAFKDALKLFQEDPTKTRELGIGQAGEIVATNPTAQQTLAGLQAQAAIPNAPTANAQQRFLRDVARKVLSRPFIRKNLVVQSEHLLASTTALHGDLETLERLEASGASLEELSTAYSNAFETLQTFEQTQLDLNSAYARQLPMLVNRIAKNFDAEVEALSGRDVYSVLFKDFQVMGRLLMRIQKDAAVDAAYWQAVGSKDATINVLKFIREHMDFTGMTRDDLHSVQDLMDRIRNTIVNNTGKFPNWDGVDIAKVVGASEDVIRSVLRIVALSEPIRTDIEESKAIVEGRRYAGPISALKTKLAEEIKSGKYANAFTLYESGIGTTAIELKASRDAANFYLRDTKRLLVNLQALVEAHEIAQKIASDPELIRQRNLVYKFARVQTITHTPDGTAITFLRADPNDPPIKLEFGNSQVSHQKMVDLAVQLHSEYQAYIANPDVPGFDPRLAAGMEKSLEALEYFTDPSQNPKVRARMLPGMAAKTFDWISGKVGYAFLIPKYLTTGSVGHLADIEHIARSAYSVVVEKIGVIEAQHEDRLSSTLKDALKAHNNITPGQYELLVFNPLASSRQNYNNPGMLKPGDRIGNGETVTVEDMAYLRAWRAYDNALHEMVENTGQIKFQSVKLMFTGILFDKNGKVRIPLHHGPDTTSRQFPSVLKYWTDTWFELSPDKRIPFLDFWKDPLITGYIRGTREVDWKGSYSYRDEVRQIALDFNDPAIDLIENFDDLVNRVFELYNQKDGVEPRDIETVQNDLLSDFNDIFVKVKPFSDKGAGNPKVSLEVIGGDNSFNTPRSVLVMPPGWYKYGGVTKADRASSGRAATIAFQLAYQKALTSLRDSLFVIVDSYGERRKRIPEVGISEQRKTTKELMSSGDLLYSLGEAQRLLELVDNQLKHVNVMMDNSANPYVKDAVHMSMMRGGAQFVITSIVSGPAALIKNVGGGFQNLLLFDRMMFRNNMFYNIANRGVDMLSSGLKELVYAVTHSGNPATRGLRKLLENTENVAFIGKVSKLVLGYANRLREDYNHATDVGVNYNINLWGTTKARWKYSKTLGQPTSSNPSTLEGTANQLSLIGNTLAQYVGQMTVGYVDRGLNTKAIAAAVPLQKRFRDIAIEFGPYIEPSGLFPDKAISKGGWDTNTAAATIRDFFRRNGIGSIDGIMTDFYRRYVDDKAKETTPGELSSRTPFFTEDQFHQLQQIIAEDINLATPSTRSTFAKKSPFHAKLSVLWGYPTWFITKLVHLLDGLSNKSWIKNVGINLPTLISLGLAIALTAPLIYGAAAFIKRLFENKVTGFPTVFDAQNPQQFGQAVMAATADSVPFFGSALNMVTGAGYRTGFDLNSQFLVLNLATDATKVFKEVAQTGDLGGPMQRFASRYFFPFNVIGSRLPGASGIREISNTKNILAMGARGTGLETKLRKPGSGPSGANYSPSTPILNAAMDAIGRGDMPAFQSAYVKLVEQKRAAGSLNAESSALTALKGRNPIVSVFGTKPTRDELEQVYRRVNPSLAARARKTINAFDSAIASVPRRTVVKARTATRRTGLLRRTRLRKPTLRMKLQKPRLRRQLV